MAKKTKLNSIGAENAVMNISSRVVCKIKQKFTLVVFFIMIVDASVCAEKYNSDNIREYFSDILLIIHHNHPYYKNIPFEKQLYSKFFRNIVFYGDREVHPEVTIVDTRWGYYYTKVVVDVLEKYPEYAGYIFMQDDVLMQFWHYLNLDKNKIWFGYNEPSKFNVNRIADPEYTWWFNTTAGMPVLKKILPELNDESRSMLASNFGEGAAAGYAADFFYLPGRLKKNNRTV